MIVVRHEDCKKRGFRLGIQTSILALSSSDMLAIATAERTYFQGSGSIGAVDMTILERHSENATQLR